MRLSLALALRVSVLICLFDLARPKPKCCIKVIGVGGAGCNAVARMLTEQRDAFGHDLVQYWALNTDAQALVLAAADQQLQIGPQVTKGLGAGGDPDIGRAAAEESVAAIRQMVTGADMVFVTAGMGGGTGSGASPVVAREARLAGALTIAVVTVPFRFEGGQRGLQAEMAQRLLVEAADAVVTVSNERLLRLVPDGTSAQDAFLVADHVLRQSVAGTTDIVARPGLINVDFADVRAVLSGAGNCLVGVGSSKGENRAEDAALEAVSCPLLDFRAFQRGKSRVGGGRFRIRRASRLVHIDAETRKRIHDATEAATQAAIAEADGGDMGIIRGARGAVINVVGGPDLSLDEVKIAGEVVKKACHPDANIIFGAVVHPKPGRGNSPVLESGEIKVTVLATGFDSKFLLNYRSRSWKVYKALNRTFNTLAVYLEQRRRLKQIRTDEDENLKKYLQDSREKARKKWMRNVRQKRHQSTPKSSN